MLKVTGTTISPSGRFAIQSGYTEGLTAAAEVHFIDLYFGHKVLLRWEQDPYSNTTCIFLSDNFQITLIIGYQLIRARLEFPLKQNGYAIEKCFTQQFDLESGISLDDSGELILGFLIADQDLVQMHEYAIYDFRDNGSKVVYFRLPGSLQTARLTEDRQKLIVFTRFRSSIIVINVGNGDTLQCCEQTPFEYQNFLVSVNKDGEVVVPAAGKGFGSSHLVRVNTTYKKSIISSCYRFPQPHQMAGILSDNELSERFVGPHAHIFYTNLRGRYKAKEYSPPANGRPTSLLLLAHFAALKSKRRMEIPPFPPITPICGDHPYALVGCVDRETNTEVVTEGSEKARNACVRLAKRTSDFAADTDRRSVAVVFFVISVASLWLISRLLL